MLPRTALVPYLANLINLNQSVYWPSVRILKSGNAKYNPCSPWGFFKRLGELTSEPISTRVHLSGLEMILVLLCHLPTITPHARQKRVFVTIVNQPKYILLQVDRFLVRSLIAQWVVGQWVDDPFHPIHTWRSCKGYWQTISSYVLNLQKIQTQSHWVKINMYAYRLSLSSYPMGPQAVWYCDGDCVVLPPPSSKVIWKVIQEQRGK